MKRISLLIVVLLFLSMPVFAADPITFQWEQPAIDLPNLQGWNFYVSDVNGPPWVKIGSVTYTDGGSGPWTSDIPFTVTGAPGSTIKKYFAATAVNKDSTESTFATGQPTTTEVTKEWKIPWGAVSGPFNFTIRVIVK
jgi:hypothetical protein